MGLPDDYTLPENYNEAYHLTGDGGCCARGPVPGGHDHPARDLVHSRGAESRMSVIPCQRNISLGQQIEAFAETLKTEAHTLGDHGLSESEFYASGLFRGAIERVRGQIVADMREKREFVQHVLNHMQDKKFIIDWESAGEVNRP